ncbi:MAG: hypothetical protein ACLFO1_05370 [Spirochaetaceae bacterium]
MTFQRLIVLTAATLFITEGVVQAQAPDSASEASPEASSEEDAGAAVVADWIRLNETPERLSHQNRAELTVLSRDIQSSDPRRRRDALRRIARLYGDRREISPELTDLLVLVAVRPFVEVNMSAGSSVLSPDVRIQALQVLGEVGGTKSLSAIELVLRLEEDPAVVESALHSLQKMKAQPTEEITAGLTHLLSRRQLSLDEGVASAALETVRVLGRPPYAITDPDLFQAILGVAQGPYPRRIRQDAYDLVDELRKPR